MCRAPYDNIVNSKGVTLRRIAERMSPLDFDYEERPGAVQFGKVRKKRAPQVVCEDLGSMHGVFLR